MKKTLITMLSIWTVTASCWADYEVVDDIGWCFKKENGNVIITADYGEFPAISSSITGTVTVPQKLGGENVNIIGTHAFRGCQVSEVVLPSGITKIDANAFRDCQNLTKMTVPEGVTEIIDYAFSGSRLRSISLPNTLKKIGTYAFDRCSKLKSITLPPKITTITHGTFRYCSALKSVVMQGKVTAIGNSAFSCSGLTSFEMPETVQTVGDDAFSYCTSLEYVKISKAITAIGDYAFRSDTALLSVAFCGNCPNVGESIYSDTATALITSASDSATGWEAPLASGTWNGRKIQSIDSNALVVPFAWKDNFKSYPTKFGESFASSLVKNTGKCDVLGNELKVWNDYVTGTDPTSITNCFITTISFQEGNPVIGHRPILSETEAAKRTYTTLGKSNLADEKWNIVNGDESSYHYFMKTVKLK